MKTQQIIDNYMNRHHSGNEYSDIHVDEKDGELVIFYEGGKMETYPLPDDWDEYQLELETQQ